MRRLHEAYPGKKIVVKAWDSRQPWSITKRNAKTHVETLTGEILAMPESRRSRLILVGHSIGARITLEIMNELAAKKLKIHSAALLGAAVCDNDPLIAGSLEAVHFYVCNICNPDDWVLRLLFPVDKDYLFCRALGGHGWFGAHPRLFEARVSSSDQWGFYNHYAYIYLEELGRLLRKIPPEIEVKVMQDEDNTERVPADTLYWESCQSFGNWHLQRHPSGKFRIIDPAGVRRATGSEEKMRAAFADLIRLKK